MKRRVHILYFAALREERGKDAETVDTICRTAGELYGELIAAHRLSVPAAALRVAVNGEIRNWDAPIEDSDTVVFLPPVSGG